MGYRVAAQLKISPAKTGDWAGFELPGQFWLLPASLPLLAGLAAALIYTAAIDRLAEK